MTRHDINFRIHGDDMQFVEIALDPGATVIAEAGAMMYMGEGIRFDTRMGDGSDTGMMSALGRAARRLLTSESLFMTHFTNESRERSAVAFSAPFPGKIVPVDLATLGGTLLCQKDSFLCAARGTRIGVAFSRRLGAGLFGGEGFILQKLEGDGMAFVNAGGTVVEKTLRGETLRVDTGCIVAFEADLDYGIERSGGLRSMLFGGEGLFLATLSGTGRVWLQSLPFSRLADRILANAPRAGGRATGES